jgi:hypothetical protein
MMRTAIALAFLALGLAACGDNTKNGSDSDAAVDDGGAVDATVDAPPDANCPARALGQVGGPCTADAQCDSASGAGDGFCLHGLQGTIAWPEEGYCVNKIEGCTTDGQCGTGNVCASIDDPAGAFHACLPACGTDPCSCPNNQLCGNSFAGSAMDKNACLPGNASARDGDPCTGFAECDESSICLSDNFEHPGGQCMQVGCTIGDDTTCTTGGDGHCINPGFVSSGTGCVDHCDSDANCRLAEGYKCFDGGGSVGKYCRHPQTGDTCTVDADCGDPGIWDCKTGVTFPGGYCTLQAPCNATNGTGCSSGSSVCFDPPGAATPYCVDRCSGAAQGTCRTGYVCTPVPQSGNASGCL